LERYKNPGDYVYGNWQRERWIGRERQLQCVAWKCDFLADCLETKTHGSWQNGYVKSGKRPQIDERHSINWI